LQQEESVLKNQEMQIARQNQLLEAVDPALKEAGSQALQLLQGKEAAALNPIRQQRERDRKKLEENLARRLGSGFRTSSAGIEALSRFDQSTSEMLFNAQNTTMNQLLSLSASVRPD